MYAVCLVPVIPSGKMHSNYTLGWTDRQTLTGKSTMGAGCKICAQLWSSRKGNWCCQHIPAFRVLASWWTAKSSCHTALSQHPKRTVRFAVVPQCHTYRMGLSRALPRTVIATIRHRKNWKQLSLLHWHETWLFETIIAAAAQRTFPNNDSQVGADAHAKSSHCNSLLAGAVCKQPFCAECVASVAFFTVLVCSLHF